jgi:hypothetical protein
VLKTLQHPLYRRHRERGKKRGFRQVHAGGLTGGSDG